MERIAGAAGVEYRSELSPETAEDRQLFKETCTDRVDARAPATRHRSKIRADSANDRYPMVIRPRSAGRSGVDAYNGTMRVIVGRGLDLSHATAV